VRYERNPGDWPEFTEAPQGGATKARQKTNPIVVPALGNLITPPQPGAALIPPKRDSLTPSYIVSPALGLFSPTNLDHGITDGLPLRIVFH